MTAETIRLECLRLATLASGTKASAAQVLARAAAYLEFVLPAGVPPTTPAGKRRPKR